MAGPAEEALPPKAALAVLAAGEPVPAHTAQGCKVWQGRMLGLGANLFVVAATGKIQFSKHTQDKNYVNYKDLTHCLAVEIWCLSARCCCVSTMLILDT